MFSWILDFDRVSWSVRLWRSHTCSSSVWNISSSNADLSCIALTSVEERSDGVPAEAALWQEADSRARRDQIVHLVGAVRGDQDDSSPRRARPQLAREGDTVLLAQLDVDEREVG